jgi:ABC-type amino acid transport substrate-binding protein
MKKFIILTIFFAFIVFVMINNNKNAPKNFIDSKFLLVGTSADYPPYASIDLQTGEIVGFDIDIVKEIAHRLNKQIMIKDMPFSALVFELMYDQIDLIAAGLTPNEQRSKTVLFSRPYLDQDPLIVLLTKDKEPILGLSDLYGKQVAVNTGYTSDLFLSKYPKIELIRLDFIADALMALQSNSVYAFVAAQSSLQNYLTSSIEQEYQISTIPAPNDTYALAYAKNNTSLCKQIDEILYQMETDGTLTHLQKKWGL